ncbi:topoisomerase II-associated protein PAT1 [Colletotrichum tofieldiae]|nr:topoisomerase II-associated protein PAT1 [Colletotrichum tofieldiae]GKT77078.1 topoisomerase II-associated protein PAT1 [Colletotrichum tofieldiae]
MTSMGPSFAGHPAGMQQHPGVPGHPMAQGMPHNPGQQGPPGGGMPHQMHMAVSGPGGQVNPNQLMGGMPPGAGGPNAHALQHLNPAQNPMFQQNQFGNFNNPAAMAHATQLAQQRLFQQQQQARQALMAQQAFNANMAGVNGMPMGMQMNPMNAAQLAAMRQGMRPVNKDMSTFAVAQAQPQGPPQMAPQPGQQQMNPAQQAAAQAAVANNMAMAQQRREGMKGHCLLKLMQFSEHLSGFPGSKGKDDLSYWNSFVNQFFSTKGVFRHSVHITDVEDQADKQYEITYPALPRYFHTHFDSGVKNMQLIMEKGTTDRPLPGDGHWIENTKSSLVYWFESGSHLVATGTVRAHFDAEQKIELFEFLTSNHEEYISRKAAIEAAKPVHNWVKEWHKVNSQDSKASPEMSKKGKARPMKSPQNPPPEALVDLPESAVKRGMGVTEAVFQFLEIAEVIGQMNPLFAFYHTHPNLGPYAALEQYVGQINAAPQNLNGQPMPQGPRTPSFGQFPMGASPAQPHMQLPGSPHVQGSPAQGHMQAPGMQMQQSQQGTSSSGPSANTSPASNKRRRPSGVKMEEDGSQAPTPGGPQVNGVQNKGKPPTPRMAKRMKGNPA